MRRSSRAGEACRGAICAAISKRVRPAPRQSGRQGESWVADGPAMSTRIELAPEVADDFERILDHLVQHGVQDAASRIQDIIAAIDTLERNPMIGRPVGPANRELVIGRRSRGYLALY